MGAGTGHSQCSRATSGNNSLPATTNQARRGRSGDRRSSAADTRLSELGQAESELPPRSNLPCGSKQRSPQQTATQVSATPFGMERSHPRNMGSRHAGAAQQPISAVQPSRTDIDAWRGEIEPANSVELAVGEGGRAQLSIASGDGEDRRARGRVAHWAEPMRRRAVVASSRQQESSAVEERLRSSFVRVCIGPSRLAHRAQTEGDDRRPTLGGPRKPLQNHVVGTDTTMIQDLSHQDLGVGRHPVGTPPIPAAGTTNDPGAMSAMTVPIQDILTSHERGGGHDVRQLAVLRGDPRVENCDPDASPRRLALAWIDAEHDKAPVVRCRTERAATMDGATSGAEKLRIERRRSVRCGFEVRWDSSHFVRNDANPSYPLDALSSNWIEIQRRNAQPRKQPHRRLGCRPHSQQLATVSRRKFGRDPRPQSIRQRARIRRGRRGEDDQKLRYDPGIRRLPWSGVLTQGLRRIRRAGI